MIYLACTEIKHIKAVKKMNRELKNKTKRMIHLVLCIVLFFVFQLVPVFLDRAGLSQYSGIFSAFQYACCLVLVVTNQRRGIITSIILLTISALNLVRIILMMGVTNAVSGLSNQIFYLVTIIMLGDIFAKQEKAAVTDSLTGLYNRRGLHKKLRDSIEDNKPFYLVDIELGNFKLLNENFGHIYGDRLLKKAAERINSHIGNRGIIALKSGAEFVVILKDTKNAEEDVNKLLDLLKEKIVISSEGDYLDCYLTAFAGIVSFPSDSNSYENLLKYSDMAMVEALHANSQSACVFKPEMEKSIRRQAELEHLVKEGIENNYFYLVYQPQYILDGKKLRGFETLIRMKLPDGTFVSPGEFIPIAEMSEQIIYIDDYVIQRAMKEFRDIVLNDKPDLIVSVNVSARNIGAVGFAEKIKQFLRDTGYPAKNLEIEITEYCMVSSLNATINNINALRSIGVQFALDDFGTGYTSLNYLAKLPVNLLKIDKSLIDNIETDRQKCEFVNAIISMGHLMGCEVISEGVENEQQLSKLGDNNCDFIQGYVWGKPFDYDIARNLALA